MRTKRMTRIRPTSHPPSLVAPRRAAWPPPAGPLTLGEPHSGRGLDGCLTGLLDADLVLYVLDAGDLTRHLGGPGRRGDVWRVAAQHDDPAVSTYVDALQLSVLRETRLDGFLDVGILGLDHVTLLGRHDLKVILHRRDTFDALGNVASRCLRVRAVDLASEMHDAAFVGLDAHLPALHPLVGEQRHLGLCRDPRIADRRLGVVGHALGLVLGLFRLALRARGERYRRKKRCQDRGHHYLAVPHSSSPFEYVKDRPTTSPVVRLSTALASRGQPEAP